MKKKIVSVLLAATMVLSLAACGDDAGNDTPDTQETTPEQGDTTPDNVTADALPEAFAHITFDEGAGEGYTVVERTEDLGDLDGATYGITDSAATLSYADGPVGQALYLDGEHALNLHLAPTNTDAYTVSFWVNADRLSNYGPTMVLGYNVGRSDATSNVTWMNVTQVAFDGEDFRYFPVVWSRNVASNAQDGTVCWPWMYAFDGERHGLKEWAMVTIVASGEVQNGPTGATTVGAQYYINGQLVYDSQANYTSNAYFEYTWDATLAPNIMKPDGAEFESWFGINYWDTLYKGFVDDLWVFDSALTAGQVLSLYELGDPNVNSVAPEGTPVEEEVEPVAVDHSDVAITGTLVGALDYSTAWWTAFSDITAVPSGDSVTVNFVNWSNELANWNNFLVVLQNVDGAHSADDNADYKEYAVLRADNWGWGAGYDGIATATCDWVWETFTSDIDGAAVELTITNNGDTADVVAVVTTVDGTVYNQSYTGIAVDGDLYFCLTVDGSFIDLQ
ncbi:MAG: hypothetical protein J1E83_00415 [Lachnospiraceae bacterium]|nr:hypothetical protein [Lachnospiraceae bacterium]